MIVDVKLYVGRVAFSLLFLVSVSFGACGVKAQVVLSEVMFDASGNESHDEFIEIANLSTSDPADLSGWQVSDGSGSDKLQAVDAGLILMPGQFGIILDQSYFDNSTLYDSRIPPESLILTIDNGTFGSRGLSNSTAETIALLNADGLVLSEYTYSLGNPPGFSDEKIDLNGPNVPGNWADSKIALGTPGARNSVSPLSFDLAVSSEDFRFSPQRVAAGEQVEISLQVRNIGLASVTAFRVQPFLDADRDSSLSAGEEIGAGFDFAGVLAAGDSATFSFHFAGATSGSFVIGLIVTYAPDQNPSNNLAVRAFAIGATPLTVRINEIMYSPVSGQSEWVELANRSTATLGLQGWAISDDNATTRAVISAAVTLGPDQFVVLAKDSSLALSLGLSQADVVVLPDFPALNNDSDAAVLYDLTDATIDRVDYRSDWGGDTGVSLEKVNPDLPANDAANWSSSVSGAGSTAARRNSIFVESLPGEASLSLAPNPFSPDGDGVDDFVLINYSLPVTTAAVNVKIYDLRGRLIRFLLNNQASGSQSTVVWDGKNETGELARMGIYVVFLQALNAEAGLLETEKTTVVLAGKL